MDLIMFAKDVFYTLQNSWFSVESAHLDFSGIVLLSSGQEFQMEKKMAGTNHFHLPVFH